MRHRWLWIASLVASLTFAGSAADQAASAASEPKGAQETMKSVLDFTVKDIDGNPVKLGERFDGDVLLIVNTASKCGFTPQYADLQALYETYHEKGLEILAFPSNDFGGQEPGSESDIKSFCTSNYQVTFPLFSKIPVKGENKDPLYRYLTDSAKNPDTGGEIKWNFTKFLVDREGNVVARYEPKVKPTDAEVTQSIEKELARKQ
jgi:glutathione peroxidase